MDTDRSKFQSLLSYLFMTRLSIKDIKLRKSAWNFKSKHRGLRKYFPSIFVEHSHKQENFRRRKQIKKGFLTYSNGLIKGD